MTILTTSRRPSPEIRTFAKDLAFALGCDHMNRGKTGLRDLSPQDPVILFIERHQQKVAIRLEVDGETEDEIILSGWSVGVRENEMQKGIFTSDQSVYDLLNQYVPATMVQNQDATIIFDGRQRRLYRCDREP
jgi:U3 small nucleolar ribonucleoprotein protein IMP4